MDFSEVTEAQQRKNQVHAVLQMACEGLWGYLIQHGKDYLPRLFIVPFLKGCGLFSLKNSCFSLSSVTCQRQVKHSKYKESKGPAG